MSVRRLFNIIKISKQTKLKLTCIVFSHLQRLDTNSSPIMFPNTQYMDARAANFNAAGRDQIIADQVHITQANTAGAMQSSSGPLTYSFSPDT